MTEADKWGTDPSVRFMRKVFNSIEKTQAAFLNQLGIDLYDLRIRGWREKALPMFEKAWGIASGMGRIMDEQRSAAVYIHCLAKVIRAQGIEIPDTVLAVDEDIEKILNQCAH